MCVGSRHKLQALVWDSCLAMETVVVQSDANGLFVLVNNQHCRPKAKTLFELGEKVTVDISDKSAKIQEGTGYSENWEAFPAPPKPKKTQVEKKFNMIDLIENEWYFVPLTSVLMLWSFAIGWVLGWALIKVH